MLSYRHAFHAGNHADVLKHIVLRQLVAYMLRKEKGFAYIDTHAGAGYYRLNGSAAQRSREADNGITRLWQASKKLPPAIDDYLASVRLFNTKNALQFYPGSPFLVAPYIRPQDSMRLCEWHPREIIQLRENFTSTAQADPLKKFPVDTLDKHHCKPFIVAENGFKHLRAALPPPTRRGLIMIDPSYEDKNDYAATRLALNDALMRFPQGVYAIWYPQITRDEAIKFPAQLKRLCSQHSWCHISLRVKQPTPNALAVQRLAANAALRARRLVRFTRDEPRLEMAATMAATKTSYSELSSQKQASQPAHTNNQGSGLFGSGLFIVNPPYDLLQNLKPVLPFLVKCLGQDHYAKHQLEEQIL